MSVGAVKSRAAYSAEANAEPGGIISSSYSPSMGQRHRSVSRQQIAFWARELSGYNVVAALVEALWGEAPSESGSEPKGDYWYSRASAT
jgi:hypothetical protein